MTGVRLRWTLVLATAVMVPGASGTTLFYDRTSWQAETTNLTTLDFEGLADPNLFFIQFVQPPGLTLSGVNFTSPSTPPNNPADLFVIDPAFDPAYDWGSGAILDAQNGVPTQIVATLPPGITAIGLDLLSPNAISPPDYLVTLSTGESFTVSTAAQPVRTFIGFTSNVAITSITFTPQLSGSDASLDNFSFGTAVPEPASFGLVGLFLGIIGIGIIHRPCGSKPLLNFRAWTEGEPPRLPQP